LVERLERMDHARITKSDVKYNPEWRRYVETKNEMNGACRMHDMRSSHILVGKTEENKSLRRLMRRWRK